MIRTSARTLFASASAAGASTSAGFARPAILAASATAASSVTGGSSSSSRAGAAYRSLFPTVDRPRFYHEKVIDHYENPRNVGSFNKADKDVGIGLVGAPACGDVMKLSIKVDENGIISDVRFKTFGCGSAIASSSYMTERVKGMSLEQAGQIKNTEIAKELCLPPVKLHCSMLAEDAINAAIRDYKKKRDLTGNTKAGHIDVTQDVATGQTNATPHVGSQAM
ncbi:unnamed protein product [Tilletia controversa]|uniref:Iron-sulfur cluster assembly protein n=3 Tax=Tilletia TaxID=13289 RepID=A0A8X7ML62_9BASI|nr:hypothetical protein CF336_g8364 [Tilletia laevis]KAE8187122.1 hypothetical protein CF328_g7011 [Tilletia controversa]KAE8242901.1 hypothetical protein A4X03_0g7931 [Tilletia caries]KAE8184466.1 hypothetical protein CF335_g8013 [Tilletia laevis]KAE8240390.1 hypothetical protein A4X06_0g7789 [Tilletia controversa]